MYRFYKGEKTNPFDNINDSFSARFWNAEETFETSFFTWETFKLHAFFDDHGMSDRFMKFVTEKDKEYLTENSKKPVFELWLEYLFKYKYYGEYGSENIQEKKYFSIAL